MRGRRPRPRSRFRPLAIQVARDSDGGRLIEQLERHARRALGHEVRIELADMIEGRKRFRGILRGVAGQDALLTRDDAKSEEERDVAIPMRAIAEARLVLTDALITEALRRGKSGLPPEMPPADDIAGPKKGRGKSLGPRPKKADTQAPQEDNEEE